jgi:outer membrane lipoprotein SlyB
MKFVTSGTRLALVSVLLAAWGSAGAQSSVGYGRITAVNRVDIANSTAQTRGALVGGTVGLVSGRNQSGSNQALRTGAGAFAGNRIAAASTGTQAFEYTILQGGRTVTVVTNEAGLRVGDCVAVERGNFTNLRLVDDARCNARPAAPPSSNAVREATACESAKTALLQAETDDAFDRAERRVRLLCAD